jgi:hypothetical protein
MVFIFLKIKIRIAAVILRKSASINYFAADKSLRRNSAVNDFSGHDKSLSLGGISGDIFF